MSPRQQRWIAATATTVEALAGEAAGAAAADGRLFIDGRRTSDASAPVPAGARIDIHAPRQRLDDILLLHRDDDWVIVDKGPALATEPERAGAVCARALAAASVGVPEASLHAVNRLDVGVSGVVVFAATDRARKAAAGGRATGQLRRTYLGLAHGAEVASAGTWDGPLRHPVRGRVPDPRPATTRFRLLGSASGAGATASLLELMPVTGRTHQLRLHAALAGAPLVGDRPYGGLRRLIGQDGSVEAVERIALHAWRVVLAPAALDVVAPVPTSLRGLAARLGLDVPQAP